MRVEGRTISVTANVTLPDQPTAGLVARIPLGGDGFTAPQAAYAIAGHAVTGDVSGGNAVINLTMDPRFCSLVQFVTFEIAQGTSADAEFRMRIAGQLNPPMVDQGLQVAVSSTVTGIEVSRTWSPPAVVLGGAGEGPSIQAIFKNVDGDVYDINAYIFLFDIRVRELTPMGPLLWARGST